MQKLPKDKLRISLPAVCRNTKKWIDKINECKKCGFEKWEVANYWGIYALEGIANISFDTSLYMFNSQAVLQAGKMGAERITLPVEATEKNMSEIIKNASLPVVCVIYQDVPLFTSAVCIRNNQCSVCDGKEKWIKLKKDGKNYMALSKDCQVMLFDEKAREIETSVNADFYRMDFCYKKYTADEVSSIVSKLIG